MRFESVLSEHHIPTAPHDHEHVRAGWLQFDCPFCSKGWRHWRMGYNLRYGYVNCWSCGGHSLVETLVHLTGMRWSEAKKILGDLTKEYAPVEQVRGKLQMPKGMGEIKSAHRRYLKGRGFDPDVLVKLWAIKGTDFTSGLGWRVVVPFIYHGEVVSWTSRSISSKGSRWRSASAEQEILNHKNLLYGFDYIRHAAIICEGPTDVWRIGPGAIATCGTGYSQAQVNAISRISRRIVCFDTSPDAQARARLLCNSVEPFPGVTMNVVLDAEDPGSAGPKEVKALRRLLMGD